MTVDNLRVAHELRNLYKYLIDRGCINQLLNHDEKCLSIFSRDVLNKIREGDSSWESMVPAEVAEVIKSQGLPGARRLWAPAIFDQSPAVVWSFANLRRGPVFAG